MPASASARQLEHAACPWFRKQAVQQVVREEMRQAAPELEGTFGRRGLLVRGCRPLPGELQGHRLHTLHDLWLGPEGLEGEFRSDESRLPLCSASMSLVFSLHALECARDPAGLVAECARTLEPDGTMLVLALNPFSPFHLRWVRQGLQAFSAAQVARMLRSAGLEVHACRPVGVWWRARDALVDTRTPPLPALRSSNLLIARRREHGLTPLRLQRRPVPLGASASPG